jgi:hypothetical protein
LGWFCIFVLYNTPNGFDLLNFFSGTFGIVLVQLFGGIDYAFVLLGASFEFQFDFFWEF